jgi:hypothetical protein
MPIIYNDEPNRVAVLRSSESKLTAMEYYIATSHIALLLITVSLPREWFQEIKHMMTMHSTHGLFLTCTQESHLYSHTGQLIDIYTKYSNRL